MEDWLGSLFSPTTSRGGISWWHGGEARSKEQSAVRYLEMISAFLPEVLETVRQRVYDAEREKDGLSDWALVARGRWMDGWMIPFRSL